MEGWFPCRYGEQTCLRIAKAAECRAQHDERSKGVLPADHAAGLLRLTKTGRNSSQGNALPIVGVDARCQSIPGQGDVLLDTSLYGRSHNAPGASAESHPFLAVEHWGASILGTSGDPHRICVNQNARVMK